MLTKYQAELDSDVMQSELFEANARGVGADEASVEFEHWMWAERVIREVNQEAAAEDRSKIDFVRALTRWEEMIGLLNFLELGMHRRGNEEGRQFEWHEGICTVLISLGNALKSWSKTLDSSFLEEAEFDNSKHERLLANLRESYDQWHVERSRDRIELILSAISDD